MASSSTSPIYKSFKYDVFLSFRGEDTRTSFVDHLYYALHQKNIHTYKDDERIKKGKRIRDELIGSIEDSKLYIIVFSKNYASSRWCLDELVKIMECHKTTEHTAYPIFYDVEPSEVRKQSTAVETAFEKHENEEAVRKWRIALKEAADLAGWELKNTADRHEAKFIQKVVGEISLELRSINYSVDEKLVGMETRMNDVLSSLGTGLTDVRMIGIKGMGGGGKTTLARAVFNQISFQFEGKSFVDNVREVSKDSLFGLKSLQNQILSDVFNEQGITVTSVDGGKNIMKRRMRDKKVLLVLDDVDHIEQLEALAGESNWFKPGSRIIVTTRDEQVLVAHGVKSIHNIRLFLDEEAICLFSRHAFGRVIPNLGYKELSQQVVHYAAGLSLTIKVLGSFLCGKSELEWIDFLERLKIIPLMETLKKLEISYISLEEDYKEIFLNVACIMKGWLKDFAIKVLESCGFNARIGLRVLEQKSLITINNDECLGMHDHIEELGRNIVRRLHPDKPNKHSRLWINEEIEDILANDLGTEATRYIQFKTRKLTPETVMKGIRKMKELRFLDVYLPFIGASKSDCCCWNWRSNKFPNALRYLCWNHYPFMSLPKTFQADNLVALYMTESRILQLWQGGERKVLNKLRFLDLSFSKLRTFDICLTPNLETLNLIGCRDLVDVHLLVGCLKLTSIDLSRSSLRTLDLGSAPNLELLDLGRCLHLIELHMLGTSPNLRFLNLNECSLLEKLPEGLCQSECLKRLIVRSTKIKDLPESICMLKHLESLKLDDCSFLEKLPEDLGRLECLKKLTLSSAQIRDLPDSICMLKHLISLKLNDCLLLEKLPRDLGQLECLKKLTLTSAKIEDLPDSICMLKHLISLKLDYCLLLEKLPTDLGQLNYLKKLTLRSTKVVDLPDSICMLKHLISLNLDDCSLLEKLPEDLGQLECLEKLSLNSCKSLRDIPDSICNMRCLKHLNLEYCIQLEKLPEELRRLECLEKLAIKGTSISHLPYSIFLL